MQEMVWILWRKEESLLSAGNWIAIHWFIQLVSLIVHWLHYHGFAYFSKTDYKEKCHQFMRQENVICVGCMLHMTVERCFAKNELL